MSKSGRYSADRKKVESIAASKSITVADCGTIFAITEAGTAITLTLPTVAAAGNGWWARFVMIADSGSSYDVTIAQSTSDTNDIVLGKLVTDDGTHANIVALGADGVSFDTSASVPGDWGEIWTDGTKWYGNFYSSAAAGVVSYSA